MQSDYHNNTAPGASRQQNQYMERLLRSAEHARVSDRILLLTFTGRKSGKPYSTPLSYLQEGSDLICLSDSPWWRNLEQGGPVTIVLRGQEVAGHAVATNDPPVVLDGLRRLAAKDPDDVKYFGVQLDTNGQPNERQLQQAAEHNALIRISLT